MYVERKRKRETDREERQSEREKDDKIEGHHGKKIRTAASSLCCLLVFSATRLNRLVFVPPSHVTLSRSGQPGFYLPDFWDKQLSFRRGCGWSRDGEVRRGPQRIGWGVISTQHSGGMSRTPSVSGVHPNFKEGFFIYFILNHLIRFASLYFLVTPCLRLCCGACFRTCKMCGYHGTQGRQCRKAHSTCFSVFCLVTSFSSSSRSVSWLSETYALHTLASNASSRASNTELDKYYPRDNTVTQKEKKKKHRQIFWRTWWREGKINPDKYSALQTATLTLCLQMHYLPPKSLRATESIKT